jgi:hypothetical protein
MALGWDVLCGARRKAFRSSMTTLCCLVSPAMSLQQAQSLLKKKKKGLGRIGIKCKNKVK